MKIRVDYGPLSSLVNNYKLEMDLSILFAKYKVGIFLKEDSHFLTCIFTRYFLNFHSTVELGNKELSGCPKIVP